LLRKSAKLVDSENWIETLVCLLALEPKDNYRIESGPVYYIPQSSIKAANVVHVENFNREVLEREFKYTKDHISELQPCVAKVINNQAVAICRTVRRSSFALEAGVDAAEGHRKRGYGSEVVAAWANKVWESGLVPCYSTSWGNRASIALASKLRMIQIATEMSLW
jgi:hypothetical protein